MISKRILCKSKFVLPLFTAVLLTISPKVLSQSLDIPVKGYGISFGNSKRFNGVRLNFRDRNVEEINGINVTLWSAKHNDGATVSGLSVGIMPEAGKLSGVQIGALGVSGKEVTGINLGLIGVGSDGDLNGITVGGIGAGAGRNIKGLTVGLIGAGAGNDVKGIALGGIGVGAGDNCTGITIGGIGAGAGNDLSGIAIGGIGAGAGNGLNGIVIGGLGAGCGDNMEGIAIGGLGAGAGNNLSGITIGGLGAGCGNTLSGVAIGGIGAGAPTVKGFTIGGIATGGLDITGVTMASAWVKIEKEGSLRGVAVSAFNQVKGKQSGLSIGILNYAWTLNGVQIGLINYVRDNPKYLKVLPLFNARF